MLKERIAKLDISDGKKNLIMAAVYMFFIVAVALLWNIFFFSPLRIIGDSMNPSLSDGDIVIVNKITYIFSDIERYDIVVFPYKYDNRRNLVKRIIGLPGETVEIADGVLYINGEELSEYYGIYTDGDNDSADYMRYDSFGPIVLGEDEYFVLGDNRNHSDDSRAGDVGAVKQEDIIGKICFRISPWNGIGSLEYQ